MPQILFTRAILAGTLGLLLAGCQAALPAAPAAPTLVATEVAAAAPAPVVAPVAARYVAGRALVDGVGFAGAKLIATRLGDATPIGESTVTDAGTFRVQLDQAVPTGQPLLVSATRDGKTLATVALAGDAALPAAQRRVAEAAFDHSLNLLLDEVSTATVGIFRDKLNHFGSAATQLADAKATAAMVSAFDAASTAIAEAFQGDGAAAWRAQVITGFDLQAGAVLPAGVAESMLKADVHLGAALNQSFDSLVKAVDDAYVAAKLPSPGNARAAIPMTGSFALGAAPASPSRSVSHGGGSHGSHDSVVVPDLPGSVGGDDGEGPVGSDGQGDGLPPMPPMPPIPPMPPMPGFIGNLDYPAESIGGEAPAGDSGATGGGDAGATDTGGQI